jgi:hypothetical protein
MHQTYFGEFVLVRKFARIVKKDYHASISLQQVNRVYGVKNLSGIRIKHISNLGITKEANNNRIERRHGGIRAWVRTKRGMKERAGELIAGNVAYYNFIQPHMSLENEPPCQIFKTNRWLSLLRKTLDTGLGIGRPRMTGEK